MYCTYTYCTVLHAKNLRCKKRVLSSRKEVSVKDILFPSKRFYCPLSSSLFQFTLTLLRILVEGPACKERTAKKTKLGKRERERERRDYLSVRLPESSSYFSLSSLRLSTGHFPANVTKTSSLSSFVTPSSYRLLLFPCS